jgi:hypothetical protein
MKKNNIIGIVIILLGLSVLLHFPLLNILFAALIIWVGFKILGKNCEFSDYEQKISTDVFDSSFIFSPVNKVIVADNFKGGKISCIFSGGQLDFSNAKTTSSEIDLEISNIFAGLKVIFPKSWKINSIDSSVIGGLENKTKGTGKVTVNLKSNSIFGGMELVN